MNIQFIYNHGDRDELRELVITKICEAFYDELTIPDTVQVEFKKLPKNVFAETMLDYRFKNRIRINYLLNHREVFAPVIHELIHMNQTHTGKLTVLREGIYMYEGKIHDIKDINKLSYDEYMKLPWEKDVAERQEKLAEIIIKSVLESGKSSG